MTLYLQEILLAIVAGAVLALLFGLKKSYDLERILLRMEEKILGLEEKLIRVTEQVEKNEERILKLEEKIDQILENTKK